MSQADSASTTKVVVPAHPWSGRPAYELDTVELADRLDDIADRLDTAMLAVEGAKAVGGVEGLGRVAAFISEIRDQVKAVSNDIFPDHPDHALTAVSDSGEAAT